MKTQQQSSATRVNLKIGTEWQIFDIFMIAERSLFSLVESGVESIAFSCFQYIVECSPTSEEKRNCVYQIDKVRVHLFFEREREFFSRMTNWNSARFHSFQIFHPIFHSNQPECGELARSLSSVTHKSHKLRLNFPPHARQGRNYKTSITSMSWIRWGIHVHGWSTRVGLLHESREGSLKQFCCNVLAGSYEIILEKVIYYIRFFFCLQVFNDRQSRVHSIVYRLTAISLHPRLEISLCSFSLSLTQL